MPRFSEKYIREHFPHFYKLYQKSDFPDSANNLLQRVAWLMDLHNFYILYLPFFNEKDVYKGFCVQMRTGAQWTDYGFSGSRSIPGLKRRYIPVLLGKFEEYLAFKGVA